MCRRWEVVNLRRLELVRGVQDVQMYGLVKTMRLSAVTLCKGFDIVARCDGSEVTISLIGNQSDGGSR